MIRESISPRHTEGLGNFKIGPVNRIVQYADGLVLLAKEETVLWNGKECEKKKKTEVMRISMHPPSIQIMIDQECGIFEVCG